MKNVEDVRVTYKYNKINSSLSISDNLIVNHNKCNLEDATHVVTQITTGFNAYMVFEKTLRETEKKRIVEGKSCVCKATG